VTTYARMIDGLIAQIIPPIFDDKGREVPIESRFPPEVVDQLVEYPPRAEPPPEPTHAQLWERAIAEMRRLRQPILEVLDGLQASALALSQLERAQAFEEMGVVVLAAYAAIVSALPADIRAAFKEVTQ
jgi:hypothetical protein